MRRIITAITLFCFLSSDLSFAASLYTPDNSRGNINLAPPLVLDDIADGTQHNKEMALAMMSLQLHLKIVRMSPDTSVAHIKAVLREKGRLGIKEYTRFQDHDDIIQLFFNEVEPLSKDRPIFSIPVSVTKNGKKNHYRLVFLMRPSKDKDRIYPVVPLTQEEYLEKKADIIAQAGLGRLPVRNTEVMDRYAKNNEEIIDPWIAEHMEDKENYIEILPDEHEMTRIIGYVFGDQAISDLDNNVYKAGWLTGVLKRQRIVLIRVRKGEKLPVIIEKGKMVEVGSHASQNSKYVFVNEEDFTHLAEHFGKPGLRAEGKEIDMLREIFARAINPKLVHEVGLKYDLDWDIETDGDKWKTVNDLDRAYGICRQGILRMAGTDTGAGFRVLAVRISERIRALPEDGINLDENLGTRDYAMGEGRFHDIDFDSVIGAIHAARGVIQERIGDFITHINALPVGYSATMRAFEEHFMIVMRHTHRHDRERERWAWHSLLNQALINNGWSYVRMENKYTKRPQGTTDNDWRLGRMRGYLRMHVGANGLITANVLGYNFNITAANEHLIYEALRLEGFERVSDTKDAYRRISRPAGAAEPGRTATNMAKAAAKAPRTVAASEKLAQLAGKAALGQQNLDQGLAGGKVAELPTETRRFEMIQSIEDRFARQLARIADVSTLREALKQIETLRDTEGLENSYAAPFIQQIYARISEISADGSGLARQIRLGTIELIRSRDFDRLAIDLGRAYFSLILADQPGFHPDDADYTDHAGIIFYAMCRAIKEMKDTEPGIAFLESAFFKGINPDLKRDLLYYLYGEHRVAPGQTSVKPERTGTAAPANFGSDLRHTMGRHGERTGETPAPAMTRRGSDAVGAIRSIRPLALTEAGTDKPGTHMAKGPAKDGVPPETLKLLEEAWKLLEECRYALNPTSWDKVIQYLGVAMGDARVVGSIANGEEDIARLTSEESADGKSALIFAEKATFGRIIDTPEGPKYEPGLGILLPKLAEAGIRIAVIATNDDEAKIIEELNGKISDPDRKIVYFESIDNARSGLGRDGYVRHFYFKVEGDPAADYPNVTTFDLTNILKDIIAAFGKACAVTADEIRRMEEAARKFAVCA